MSQDEERQQEVNSVLLKAGAVIAGIALVIGLGTLILVKGLGLDDTDSGMRTTVSTAENVEPGSPLPTTALAVPTPEGEASPDDAPSSPSDTVNGGLKLNISPVFASSMEKIYLTGRYPDHDNVTLQVQRKENGAWVNFGVDAQVRAGGYETYVITSRNGDNQFRMFDPSSNQGSNVVTVTID